MSDRVKKVRYAYVKVPNRASQGVRVLDALRTSAVNLTAFSAFPAGRGNTQVDLVTEELAALKQVARKHGWRLSKVKKGFLVQGDDRVGAVHRHIAKLAAAKINVTAADAVTAGQGRFGMILWVKAKDYQRAARALGAR
jgi:hypothetical protein